MLDLVLEIAAYVALGVGVALLTYRYVAPAAPRLVRILRFRRRLKGVDLVVAGWVAASERPPHPSRPPMPEGRPEPGTASA
ncbi:MAG: hypothetical protein ACT4OS_00955 [Acidimicrobiales bacterium]